MQATKLLIVPCSAVIEYFLLNTPLSRWRIWCILQTLIGVALVYVSLLFAAVSVVYIALFVLPVPFCFA